MATIQQEIINDVDAVFESGLTLDVVHVNGIVTETVKAFFDNPYSTALAGEGDAADATPAIIIQSVDSGNVDEDSNFTILGVVYYPIEIGTDDEGVKRITLSKDSTK